MPPSNSFPTGAHGSEHKHGTRDRVERGPKARAKVAMARAKVEEKVKGNSDIGQGHKMRMDENIKAQVFFLWFMVPHLVVRCMSRG